MAIVRLTDFKYKISLKIEYDDRTYFGIIETKSEGTKLVVVDKNDNKFTYFVSENRNKIVALLEIGLY